MPVGWVAGAALVGSALTADAAGDAADTQRAGSADASRVQREMFDVSREQQRPYMESGYGSLSELNRLMGIAPQNAQGEPVVRQPLEQMNGEPAPSGAPPQEQANVGGRFPWGNRFRQTQEIVDQNGSALSQQKPSIPGAGTSNGWIPTPEGGVKRNTMIPGGSVGQPAAAPGQMPSAAVGGTGLPTGFLTQTFGPQQFAAGIDPGYQWRLQQGAQGVMNSAAAGSGSLSGPALKALMEYNQGAASQEYGSSFDRFQTQQGNIFQRLSSLAGLGQSAAAGVGAQGVATGANIGANITGAANAGAAGQIGAANAWSGGISDASSAGMWAWMNKG